MLLGTNRTDDFQDVELEHPDCLAVIWPLRDVKRETLSVKGDKERFRCFLIRAVVKDSLNAPGMGRLIV